MSDILNNKNAMMKQKGQLVGGLIVLEWMSTSCKKNYTCVCTSIGGSKDAFTVKKYEEESSSWMPGVLWKALRLLLEWNLLSD